MVRCSKFGITPAWAGKSLFPAGNALCPWDHPRVGGEKSLILATRTALMGSPPRGRGKALVDRERAVLQGITPAWAGKRRRCGRKRNTGRDHPRVGGEKFDSVTTILSFLGSPPRGRGKEDKPAHYCELSRITPAWAGKSPLAVVSSAPLQDHPRVGGEKTYDDDHVPGMIGSPPRGRGKAEYQAAMDTVDGITPAWAGKRRQARTLLRVVKDHPRVGGEKASFPKSSVVGGGSPPRGRGKGFCGFS